MKITIAGYGVEGISNLRYFQGKYPDAEFTVADARSIEELAASTPTGVALRSGADVFAGLDGEDMVVRTASLPPRNIKTSGKIWSATNEFFAECPAPIIGVTGTKGKGTTCSLIAAILRAAGKTVHLVGNIGVPALDVLPEIKKDDIVVYELSSFQLWDVEKSPQIAVVLMIEPDHLDKHTNFADYLSAKSNISKHQTNENTLIFNRNNNYSRAIAEKSTAQKVTYPIELAPAMKQALRLPGKHNLENASAAILAVRSILPDINEAMICQGLAAFTGLPHRLKFVAEKNGVKWYDDSISTTPGSAIAAIKSFDDPKILLLGGYDKGADYTELSELLSQSTSIKAIILMGANAAKIASSLKKANFDKAKIIHKNTASMEEVVRAADSVAQFGDIVILSPAAASFDQYKGYVDRGEQFCKAVNKEIL